MRRDLDPHPAATHTAARQLLLQRCNGRCRSGGDRESGRVRGREAEFGAQQRPQIILAEFDA